MAPPEDSARILPPHVEETIRTIAEVHAEHHRGATPFERLTGRTTAWVGRPKALIYLSLAVVFWLAANLGAPMLRLPAFDPPPFNGLSTAASVLALYVTILILTTQRREDVLSQRRQQLMLELAILGEQKSAKTIQLLEEMRRDIPTLRNRSDPVAEAMSEPVDTSSVLEAIKEAHAEAEAVADRDD